MKLAELLRKITEQGGIVDTDFNAVLTASGLQEFEVNDDFLTKFNQSFLTRDRAENDPEIIKKIKGTSRAEVLDGVDEQLKNFFDLLPKEKAEEISKNKNTFEKIEALSKAIKETSESGKSKLDKDIQKVEDEWADKLKRAQSDFVEREKALKQQNKDNALKFVLKNKILGSEFGEAFKPIKNDIAEISINKIKSHQHNGNPIILELDETSGNVNVRHEVEGALRDIFVDGNKKLTIDDLLQPVIDPYIKKSAGGGENNNNSNGEKKITAPVDKTGMTLAELRNHGS